MADTELGALTAAAALADADLFYVAQGGAPRKATAAQVRAGRVDLTSDQTLTGTKTFNQATLDAIRAGQMDLTSAQAVTGVKTFAEGTLLMTSASGTGEPYSDANPPESMELTHRASTPATPVAGEATTWTTDGKQLRMIAPDGTITVIGPASAGAAVPATWPVIFPNRYALTDPGAASTTLVLAAGRAQASPFVVPRATTINSLFVDVTAAVAGSTIRFGLYADSATAPGTPGNLLVDWGTVAGTAAVPVALTIATPYALTAGTVYWLLSVAQGGAPTVRAATANNPLIATATHQVLSTGLAAWLSTVTTTTGALPAGAFPGGTPTVAAGPKVGLRFT